MNHDDELLDVRLTRAQWRGVKHAIGEMWAGPQDVLYDQLALMDLGDEHPTWRDVNGPA